MYVKATPTTDLNQNTDWFTYPGVWTAYIFIIFFSWLLILSVSGCTPGMIWTIVHFSHFLGFGYWMYLIDEWFCFNCVNERCPKSVQFFKFGFRVF
ncbi:putative ORMDL family protein [Helianthus annuus]|nr:putative ORMDL family protein [Helianthus annuus]